MMHPFSSLRWRSRQSLVYVGFVLWLMLLGSTIYLFMMFAFGPHNQPQNVRLELPPRVNNPPPNKQIDVVHDLSRHESAETFINLLQHERAKAVTINNDPNHKRIVDNNQAILIVGGTDGSGTRKIVQVLEYLGTNMVVDDMGTYDIHAEIVKGWPKIVTPVIEITKSLHYDINDIPGTVRNNTTKSLHILLKETEDKIANKSLPVPENISAKKYSLVSKPQFLWRCSHFGSTSSPRSNSYILSAMVAILHFQKTLDR